MNSASLDKTRYIITAEHGLEMPQRLLLGQGGRYLIHIKYALVANGTIVMCGNM
jgi:hypothetical protein